MLKTITVSDEVWAYLSRKKIDLNAQSLDEVIQILAVDRQAAEAKKS